MGTAGLLMFPKEALASTEKKKEKDEDARVLIKEFAEMINLESDKITSIDKKSSKSEETQSMVNNLNYIYRKLTKNEDLVDAETYQMFARLSRSKSQEKFGKNLTILTYHLAELGFYFNYRNRAEDKKEKLFIVGRLERKNLDDYDGIKKIFPDATKHYSKIFKITADEDYQEGCTDDMTGLPVELMKEDLDMFKVL